jgi:hypothetical protein
MPLFASHPLPKVASLFLGFLFGVSHSDNPPTAFTGAPFDGGSCNKCRSGGSSSGAVTIRGLPAILAPDTDYLLEIQLSPLSGHPNRGGFQLTVVDGANHNAGDLAVADEGSNTEFFNGRGYLEHRVSKSFVDSAQAVWAFRWKSPMTAAGDTIRFFFIGNFCDGDGNSDGNVAFPGVRVFRLGSDTSTAARCWPESRLLRIYPHPLTDWARISSTDNTEMLEVELIDHAGHLVRSAVMKAGDALDLNGIVPGAYVLRVRKYGGFWRTQRLIRY